MYIAAHCLQYNHKSWYYVCSYRYIFITVKCCVCLLWLSDVWDLCSYAVYSTSCAKSRRCWLAWKACQVSSLVTVGPFVILIHWSRWTIPFESTSQPAKSKNSSNSTPVGSACCFVVMSVVTFKHDGNHKIVLLSYWCIYCTKMSSIDQNEINQTIFRWLK